jgi:uncharacterized protein
VAIVDTTGGSSIEDYALELFNRWGVGHRDDNDGVLLVVAAEDRKLRIQTGRGLRDRLSDQRAKQIIDAHIVPRLKRGDYDGGVVAGVEAIRRQLGFAPGLVVPPEDTGDDGSATAGLAFVGVLAAIAAGVVPVHLTSGAKKRGSRGLVHNSRGIGRVLLRRGRGLQGWNLRRGGASGSW